MSTNESEARGHTLVVTKAVGGDADDLEWDYGIQCHNEALCGGFEECPLPHEVDGISAGDGPYNPPLEGVAWEDEDEFTFHGVEHTWHYGWGWTVPFVGCCVRANNQAADDAHDIAHARMTTTPPAAHVPADRSRRHTGVGG